MLTAASQTQCEGQSWKRRPRQWQQVGHWWLTLQGRQPTQHLKTRLRWQLAGSLQLH